MSRSRLVIFAMLFSIMIAEILAGIFHQRDSDSGAYPQIYRTSDILPWELLPKAEDTAIRQDEAEFYSDIAINSLGYRGPEFVLEKPLDTYRILFLGDSFVFGWGVQEEHGVCRVLERLLQQSLPSRRIEVINAGYASGYSPDTYYVYLRHRGVYLDPDLVILGFLPRNDIDNIIENERILDGQGLPTRVVSWREYIDTDHRRHAKSRLSFLAPARRQSSLLDWLVSSLRAFHAPVRALDFMRKPTSDEKEEAWQIARASLNASAQLLRLRNPPPRFLIVAFPDSLQIHRKTWETLGLPFNSRLYAEAYPQKRIALIAQDEGFHFLDLLPEMRNRGTSTQLYFRYDGHWNKDGHRVAAELISTFLIDQNWISHDATVAKRLAVSSSTELPRKA